MVFAAGMTQLLARTTHVLDSRHKVPMTPDKYMYGCSRSLVLSQNEANL